MKTVKKIGIAMMIIVVAILLVKVSKESVSEIKGSLHESTHEGYASMIDDYIF